MIPERHMNELLLGMAGQLEERGKHPSWLNIQNTLSYLLEKPPVTFREWLMLFHQPLGEWWPHQDFAGFEPSTRLLVDGKPSEDAHMRLLDLLEIIPDSANLSGKWQRIALENRTFRKLFEELTDAYHEGHPTAQKEYVMLRRFLIEHPYVTEREIFRSFLGAELATPVRVGPLYEDVVETEEVWTCLRCGPLHRERGHWVGIKPSVCSNHQPGLPHMVRVTFASSLRKVTTGVHHRIV